ncbi:MAG TPA: lysophospholipid acyltransferase family protein [Gallionellaceae bacterium]|nr:lysophospholipid acyltransferase family protein [Gallionellaceae bacterium]
MAVHLLYAAALVLLLFPWLSDKTRIRVERRWNGGLMAILNIRIRIRGTVPDLSERNVMLVANHVSWLDIYLLNAVKPARFVSKVEVRSWPVVGWLAIKMGTLFIDRTKRHDTARVNHEVSDVLSNGGCIAVFPEGTTSNGSMLRPFHASLLQPAVHSNSQLWPAAIRYTHADGSLNLAPAYVDELSFGDSLASILSQAIIYAELEFLPPIRAQGRARRELARDAEYAIARALNLEVENKVAGIMV